MHRLMYIHICSSKGNIGQKKQLQYYIPSRDPNIRLDPGYSTLVDEGVCPSDDGDNLVPLSLCR